MVENGRKCGGVLLEVELHSFYFFHLGQII
jgi:hypothetical protein